MSTEAVDNMMYAHAAKAEVYLHSNHMLRSTQQKGCHALIWFLNSGAWPFVLSTLWQFHLRESGGSHWA